MFNQSIDDKLYLAYTLLESVREQIKDDKENTTKARKISCAYRELSSFFKKHSSEQTPTTGSKNYIEGKLTNNEITALKQFIACEGQYTKHIEESDDEEKDDSLEFDSDCDKSSSQKESISFGISPQYLKPSRTFNNYQMAKWAVSHELLEEVYLIQCKLGMAEKVFDGCFNEFELSDILNTNEKFDRSIGSEMWKQLQTPIERKALPTNLCQKFNDTIDCN